MNKRKILTVLLIIITLGTFILVFTGCKNKKRQEKAMEKYKTLVVKLRKERKKAEEASLTQIFDETTPYLKIAKACHELLKDVYEPKKKALILSLEGKALGYAHKVEKAEECFKKALQFDRDNYKIYQRYADMYYANRMFVKAAEKYGEALDIVPKTKFKDRIFIMFRLGDISEKAKEFERAQRRYGEIVKLAENYGIDTEEYREAKRRYTELKKE